MRAWKAALTTIISSISRMTLVCLLLWSLTLPFSMSQSCQTVGILAFSSPCTIISNKLHFLKWYFSFRLLNIYLLLSKSKFIKTWKMKILSILWWHSRTCALWEVSRRRWNTGQEVKQYIPSMGSQFCLHNWICLFDSIDLL